MLGPCIEGFENVSGEASGHLALRQRVGPCVCLHAGFGDLVQLQQVLPALEAYGVALCAVSYDTVENRIGYPLLSDEGTLRRLGLINERIQEDHAVYGIAPRPRHVTAPSSSTRGA